MPKNTDNRPQAGGENSRLEPAAPAVQAVTKHQAFFPSTSKSDQLFAVQAGIPLNDALEQLTLLILAAKTQDDQITFCNDGYQRGLDVWGDGLGLFDFGKKSTKAARPLCTLGLCCTYSSDRYLSASSMCPPSNTSRQKSNTSRLLAAKAGSLLPSKEDC